MIYGHWQKSTNATPWIDFELDSNRNSNLMWNVSIGFSGDKRNSDEWISRSFAPNTQFNSIKFISFEKFEICQVRQCHTALTDLWAVVAWKRKRNFPNSFSVGLLTDWILRLRAVPLFHLMLLIQCQFMEFNFEFMRKNWKDSKQIYFASANFSIYLFCLLFLMKHGKMSQKCSVRKKDQKANQPNVWCPSITIRLIWQNKNHSCKLRWEKRALKRKNQLFFVFIFSFSAISGKKICWHY